MTHYLKTWAPYYRRIESGEKRFEVRKNDRDFQVGDMLILQEYDPHMEIYTGPEMIMTVTYILHGGNFGIEDGYVVMAITPIHAV